MPSAFPGLFLGLLFLLRFPSVSSLPSPPSGTPVDVFIAGDDHGVKQFRIPALTRTGNGTLLAFAEARTDPATDCAYKWITVRRSTDNGNTWGPSIPVGGIDTPKYASGNPMSVYVPATGETLVTYGARDISNSDVYCSPGNAVYVVSDNGTDGLTWSRPVNISAQLAPIFQGLVPGPGAGIVLSSPSSPAPGRIIFSGSSGIYLHDIVFYSDDQGKTWNISSTLLMNMDESSVVELPDGRLMITMRNADHNKTCPCQAYSLSSDGGLTWSTIAYDPTLITPECEASVLSANGRIYFANPADTRTRANITVRRSSSLTPTGIEWETNTVVVGPGLTWGGYSSMCNGDSTNTWGGILFERNTTINNQPVDVISFVSFPYDF